MLKKKSGGKKRTSKKLKEKKMGVKKNGASELLFIASELLFGLALKC